MCARGAETKTSSRFPWMRVGLGALAVVQEMTLKAKLGLDWFKSCVKHPVTRWWFPKIGVPQNGWFIMENPMKMDDWGVPLVS